jgi:hypothetical protein
MNKSSLIVATALALLGNNEVGTPASMVISKKEIAKRVKPEKCINVGRNRPAKGYDPITKMWIKETK